MHAFSLFPLLCLWGFVYGSFQLRRGSSGLQPGSLLDFWGTVNKRTVFIFTRALHLHSLQVWALKSSLSSVSQFVAYFLFALLVPPSLHPWTNSEVVIFSATTAPPLCISKLSQRRLSSCSAWAVPPMNSLLILPLLVILDSATSSSASRLCVGARVSSLPFNESLSDLLAWTNCFALKQFTAPDGRGRFNYHCRAKQEWTERALTVSACSPSAVADWLGQEKKDRIKTCLCFHQVLVLIPGWWAALYQQYRLDEQSALAGGRHHFAVPHTRYAYLQQHTQRERLSKWLKYIHIGLRLPDRHTISELCWLVKSAQRLSPSSLSSLRTVYVQILSLWLLNIKPSCAIEVLNDFHQNTEMLVKFTPLSLTFVLPGFSQTLGCSSHIGTSPTFKSGWAQSTFTCVVLTQVFSFYPSLLKLCHFVFCFVLFDCLWFTTRHKPDLVQDTCVRYGEPVGGSTITVFHAAHSFTSHQSHVRAQISSMDHFNLQPLQDCDLHLCENRTGSGEFTVSGCHVSLPVSTAHAGHRTWTRSSSVSVVDNFLQRVTRDKVSPEFMFGNGFRVLWAP